jgi:glycosyltransferase involved in cell wall biosynthesis
MRIVALGLRGFPNVQGGIEKHCEQLYPRLVNLGCTVVVISRSSYTGKKTYDYKGVKIIPIWSPRHKSLETIFHTLFGILIAKTFKPDLVHFHAVGPSLFVPFAKRLGVRVIATHHGFDYERAKWGLLAKILLKQGERRMCKADCVIAVSDHIRNQLKMKYNCRVETIPNGVELPEILPPGDFCRKWKVTPRKYFFFLGRLVPEKCIHDLFDAFSEMHTDWKLVIGGDSDHNTSYSRELRKRAKKHKNVVMTGFISGTELQELFSNAGCFVLPSSLEGLPIALLESLSFGLQSIVSDIPPNRSIDHPSVHYFPLHDTIVLRHLLSEVTEKKILIGSGRDYVSTLFNWDSIASNTLKQMQQLF